MSTCYKLKGKVWRTGGNYYVLYLYVRGVPQEVRETLDALVGREVDIAILCP
jgi:hypothetical protein